MPRPVSIRVSYRHDSAHLLRLQTAVSKDVRRSEDWRNTVRRHLNAVVQLFLQAEAADLEEGDEHGRARRKVGPGPRRPAVPVATSDE